MTQYRCKCGSTDLRVETVIVLRLDGETGNTFFEDFDQLPGDYGGESYTFCNACEKSDSLKEFEL